MKYCVYTKWHWKNGLISQTEMEAFMRDEIKPSSKADDIIWWKIDGSHHGALITYPSEEVANDERDAVLKNREESYKNGLELLEETVGPVMVQMSDL